LPPALPLRTFRRLVQESSLRRSLKGVYITPLRLFPAGPPQPIYGGRHAEPKPIRRGSGRRARIDHAIPRMCLEARALVGLDACWADCPPSGSRQNRK
jgi:hypothetical protein